MTADPNLRFVGIDPGASGAVAELSPDGDILRTFTLPTFTAVSGKIEVDARKLLDLLGAGPCDIRRPALVCVERVHAFPRDSVVSAFSFGVSTGKLLAVLEVLNWPVERVLPTDWQKEVLRGTAKSKGVAIAWCQSRWPTATLTATPRCKSPHDGICDALCLAEYARRRIQGVSPS